MSLSNKVRLLRSLATLGWSEPKLASSMASARRIRDSAFESWLVSRSSPARLLSSVAIILAFKVLSFSARLTSSQEESRLLGRVTASRRAALLSVKTCIAKRARDTET